MSHFLSPLAVGGQFLRYVPFLHEFLHRVGGGRLSGAVVLEAARILLIKRMLPPDISKQTITLYISAVYAFPRRTHSLSMLSDHYDI